MRAEAGSSTVELVLLTPLLVLFMVFVVALGRLASARAEVDGAARDRLSAREQPLNRGCVVGAA